MTYEEMTRAEWLSITDRLGGPDGWYDFYNVSRPRWWRFIARWKFDHDADNLALRRKCVQYGGFDPADVVRIVEE